MVPSLPPSPTSPSSCPCQWRCQHAVGVGLRRRGWLPGRPTAALQCCLLDRPTERRVGKGTEADGGRNHMAAEEDGGRGQGGESRLMRPKGKRRWGRARQLNTAAFSCGLDHSNAARLHFWSFNAHHGNACLKMCRKVLKCLWEFGESSTTARHRPDRRRERKREGGGGLLWLPVRPSVPCSCSLSASLFGKARRKGSGQ